MQKVGQSRFSRSYDDENGLYARASVDAIHYSTKLEGNPLTLEQVTSVLNNKKIKVKNQRDLKEIINYAKARTIINEKYNKGNLLTIKFILELHNILLTGIVRGKLKGHFREKQNVIKDSSTNDIIYLPPEWSEVKKLMKDLVAWTNNSLLDQKSPLVIAAIFHYQFVTIHPFLDGNGRLARLLSNFILLSNNYTVSKYSALEKQHEQDRMKYYSSLRKLQGQTYYDVPKDIKLSPWIEYWLDCLNNTYIEALDRIKKIPLIGLKDSLELDHRLRSALSLFKKHKKLKAIEYESIMGIGRTQAVADLKKLMDLGHIKKIGGGRSTVYSIK